MDAKSPGVIIPDMFFSRGDPIADSGGAILSLSDRFKRDSSVPSKALGYATSTLVCEISNTAVVKYCAKDKTTYLFVTPIVVQCRIPRA
jgi:hypothetical protein